MSSGAVTSMQRVQMALEHHEPDRVPVFLLFTTHGAAELGLPIRQYFSSAAHVADGQIRLLEKFGHDCLNPFFYAAVETEAFGGEVVFYDDGPPNAGQPLVASPDDILGLRPPVVRDAPCLQRVLECERLLRAHVGDRVPIVGTVLSPFSLPVMQLGFERYIELLHERPDLFDRLMQVNEAFCVEWANAQLAAGAHAISYFDPVSSPTIIPPAMYRRLGQPVATRTIARIKGPTAIHLGSARTTAIIADVAATGAIMLGASGLDDLAVVKAACRNRLAVIGNLNGVAMRTWSHDQAVAAVKAAVAAAGPGGGFILSDNHGEIPWQVPDDVLFAVVEAARTWGRYPLTWTDTRAEAVG